LLAGVVGLLRASAPARHRAVRSLPSTARSFRRQQTQKWQLAASVHRRQRPQGGALPSARRVRVSPPAAPESAPPLGTFARPPPPPAPAHASAPLLSPSPSGRSSPDRVEWCRSGCAAAAARRAALDG